MIDRIGFDLDGTLWDYADQYATFFGKIVKHLPGVHSPSVSEVHAVTGLAAADYISTLFPELKNQPVAFLQEIFHEAEIIGCDEAMMKSGLLYNKMEDTLHILSGKYKLFIASNCEPLYLENFLKTHNLSHYFSDVICQHSYGSKATKGENILEVIRRNSFHSTVFVGDAQSDADAAKFANVPFIWASYGYGSVPDAKYIINQPIDLLSRIQEI